MLVSKILSTYQTDKVLGDIGGKGHCYGSAYDEIFQKFDRESHEITLLEIGIQKGGSISAWKDFFINGEVIGIDIEDQILEEYRRNDVQYIFEDVMSEKTFELIKHSSFDIIIDDGNHHLDYVLYVVQNFNQLLKIGGVLIIEDCQNPFYWLRRVQEVLPENFELNYYDTTSKCGNYDDFLIVIKKLK